jgi:hypothetical protein
MRWDGTFEPEPDFAGCPPTSPALTARSAGGRPLRAPGSARHRAQALRASRRDTFDEATLWGARALRTYTFLGFGFFFTLGMAAVSQTGFETVGDVYLGAAGIFALVFLINLPRLYHQERLYERHWFDSDCARAVAIALAEGDDLTLQEAA